MKLRYSGGLSALLLTVFSAGAISAQRFSPAQYAEQSDTIYLEIAPLSSGLSDVKDAVNKVMGPGGFTLLSTQIQAATGLNLFDPVALRNLGINPDSPIGITTNIPSSQPSAETEIPVQAEPEVAIIIPATDSAVLYNKLKEVILQQQNKAKEGESANSEEAITELKKGELMSVGSGQKTFIARGKSHLIISSQQVTAERAKNPAKESVSSAGYYQALNKEILSRNGGKMPFMTAYINPVNITKLSKMQNAFLNRLQRGAAGSLPEDHPMMKESQENMTGAGGFLAVNSTRIGTAFIYTYKPGYLADKTKIMPRILMTDASPLSIDYFPLTPVAYLMLRFNLPELYDVLKTLLPEIENNMAGAEGQFNQEFGLSLENDIIKSLQGTFSGVLGSLPPEAKIKSISAWEGYLSFGIRDGKSSSWNKLMKASAAKLKLQAKERPKARLPFMKNEQHPQGSLWVITRQGGFGNLPNVKSESIYVLISKNEVILTNSKANLGKALKKGESPLTQKLLNMDYNKATSMFYLHVPAIVKYVEKSSMKAFAGPYLTYFSKIAYISVFSSVEGNVAISDFTIKFR